MIFLITISERSGSRGRWRTMSRKEEKAIVFLMAKLAIMELSDGMQNGIKHYKRNRYKADCIRVKVTG